MASRLRLEGASFASGPYRKIRIPDAAFAGLFALFQQYSWSLDDTPGGNDREINPNVLGYIFEKYINQKEFGAYYTRPEITEYLCEQTIHQLVLDAATKWTALATQLHVAWGYQGPGAARSRDLPATSCSTLMVRSVPILLQEILPRSFAARSRLRLGSFPCLSVKDAAKPRYGTHRPLRGAWPPSRAAVD